MRLASPTFNGALGVKHPLTKTLRFVTTSYPCPPCRLTEATFEAGAGLAVVAGGATNCVRVLLEVLDAPTAPRQNSESKTLRVCRRCACALRADSDDSIYTLIQNGPLEITSLLLQVRKLDYIHAIVSLRQDGQLILHAFWALPGTDVTKFRQFFIIEADIHKAMAENSELTLRSNQEETPLRIASMASDASASTSRLQWSGWTPLS